MAALLGVSVRAGARCPAECDKAPLMYEMKGASSGLAAPGQPVARLPDTARRPPVPGARENHRFPAKSRVPGCPGRCPFPTVKVFLLPR